MGISLFAWCSTKIKVATSPAGVSGRQMFGAAWLCGMGFTMSLFIGQEAFDEGDLLSMAGF